MKSYKIPHTVSSILNCYLLGDGEDLLAVSNLDELKKVLFDDIGKQLDKFFSNTVKGESVKANEEESLTESEISEKPVNKPKLVQQQKQGESNE